MSLARLAIAAVIALALVSAATLGSAWLLLHDAERTPTRELGRIVSLAHARASEDTRRLLRQVCTRDQQLERLARELAVGGNAEAEAQRTALGLERALGAQIVLLVEQDGRLQPLVGERTIADALSPSALARASRAPLALSRAGAWQLISSCDRPLNRDRALWVALALPLATHAQRLLPEDNSHFLVVGDAQAQHPEDALALTLPSVHRDDDGAALFLRATSAATPFPLGLWPLALLATVLGALLAYYAVRTRELDESVLVELERAAERVAMGDLSARIDRRSGGRADQTFQTFDRMTQELRDMRARLADAERESAWQDIARRIAHEIKNPLSPIQLAMETLRKAHAKQLPEFDEIFEESTRAILDEVRRIEHIVREFSEFARLPKPRPGQLELGALVEDTVNLYRPDDVRVQLSRPEGPLDARVDREQIAQVLVNLLQNAFDAARAAGAPRVEVTLERKQSNVLIHVDDNGRGIARDARERVFEPYYTTKEHGTGLGLAIARRIAVEHHGSLEASDSPLGGARFTLRVPAG